VATRWTERWEADAQFDRFGHLNADDLSDYFAEPAPVESRPVPGAVSAPLSRPLARVHLRESGALFASGFGTGGE
jgi:hypothetical protein